MTAAAAASPFNVLQPHTREIQPAHIHTALSPLLLFINRSLGFHGDVVREIACLLRYPQAAAAAATVALRDDIRALTHSKTSSIREVCQCFQFTRSAAAPSQPSIAPGVDDAHTRTRARGNNPILRVLESSLG